eukprot:6971154-Alexandrium_andersonii.AAC.1
MAKRVANLCRAVHQGELKNPTCAWVLALPWAARSSPAGQPKAKAKAKGKQAKPGKSKNSPSAASAAAPGKYVHGWDVERRF